MKQRNIAVCILLLFVTCGIYGIYWMIVLNDETNALSGRIGTSGGTVFLFSLITCGIYSLFWMYQMGNAVEIFATNSTVSLGRRAGCLSASQSVWLQHRSLCSFAV